MLSAASPIPGTMLGKSKNLTHIWIKNLASKVFILIFSARNPLPSETYMISQSAPSWLCPSTTFLSVRPYLTTLLRLHHKFSTCPLHLSFTAFRWPTIFYSFVYCPSSSIHMLLSSIRSRMFILFTAESPAFRAVPCTLQML